MKKKQRIKQAEARIAQLEAEVQALRAQVAASRCIWQVEPATYHPPIGYPWIVGPDTAPMEITWGVS